MAFFKRSRSGSLGRDFRNNKELQKFVLTEVISTGKSLGAGSYGSVEEVAITVIVLRINEPSVCTGNLSTPPLCWKKNS